MPWARSSSFSNWILLPTTHSDKVLVLVSKWHEDWLKGTQSNSRKKTDGNLFKQKLENASGISWHLVCYFCLANSLQGFAHERRIPSKAKPNYRAC